jgi:predicted outer membrane lipoprotein
MNALIYFVTGLAAAFGIGIAIWSFLDTRKKYYQEYMSRKPHD